MISLISRKKTIFLHYCSVFLMLIASEALAAQNNSNIATENPGIELNTQQLQQLYFPIKNHGLSPRANIPPKKVALLQLETPLFIVGDDHLSLAWLRKHARRLKKLNATGIIVAVADFSRWQSLQKRFGLGLIPVQGNVLHDMFGIDHYPVLISKHLAEQ